MAQVIAIQMGSLYLLHTEYHHQQQQQQQLLTKSSSGPNIHGASNNLHSSPVKTHARFGGSASYRRPAFLSKKKMTSCGLFRTSSGAAAVIFLANIWVLLTLPASIQSTHCYTSALARGVEGRHCEKALEKIIYDVNQTLDDDSRSLTVFHKTCLVNVQKPRRSTPSRGQIEAAVFEVIHSCPGKGGVTISSTNLIAIVHRTTSKNTYEINQPRCDKQRCAVSQEDCMAAFQSLPLNRKGIFIGQERVYASNATRGNCLVKIATSDYAPFRASHVDVGGSFRVLVNGCKQHAPGVIFVNGGTAGFNGDLRISIRNSDHDRCS
ncbi:hypothetical protein PCANC_07961 [Puccinia coronata f. sp. avenae]|uniref:Uncharacterized protein n=1 Tax=Puccinia coronata f. sp. avenae TaxID=200324 RepID=A0A2N5UYH1_9BASI|nr:hypothetical protein PCANC_07961 [Puccinia coronata f. sp. avenae]